MSLGAFMCKYAHMIGDRNEPFPNVLENRNNVLSVSHQVSDCEKEGFYFLLYMTCSKLFSLLT